MLQVFIDTNVYLTFYGFTAEDLEELRKLRAAIDNGDLRLWTTGQLDHEFRRNRENRVADSIKGLKGLKPSEAVPQMARNLPEFSAFRDARREFGRHLNAVQERLNREVAEESLAADVVLRELMESAQQIPVTEAVLEAARRRSEVGNPPGKRGSLGDAINWECLLSACPDSEDLYFVTQDGDYLSPVQDDSIAAYLAREWRERKGGEVHLYQRISDFLLEMFHDIELASEFEKELRVQALVSSPNFEETHRRIARLSGYTEFSDQQARDLFEAALRNSQISWISQDSDVQTFFRDLVNSHQDLFDPRELERFHEYFDDEEGWDEVPTQDALDF